ncbi:protein brown-like isoform X2 [Sitodiplosis mosellana]|uniref:protein brown-like isoform X2 n=1 Tax=Sitodiplosis mosellana TaxID=263140 RepID=UPI0024450893|nr:protein brown-like isoform X2 [Sitodiplosis mosellana]
MEHSLNLEWKHLNLEIKKSEFSFWKCRRQIEEKTILNDVSGSLKSGQLIAILGESGAGKTTLLAGISYRFRGKLDGQLLLNGTPIDRSTMTKISCFVPQFEITIDSLTPNEHLYFMAELKLDRKWSRSRKYQRVDFLLREMGLQSVANSEIKTLSGGERKKLNLATDLLTNPPIIFCDEPTTGLDSFGARKVIEALKYLSTSHSETSSMSMDDQSNEMSLKSQSPIKMPPKAVICSIHQPTSDIFQCFSEIILMHTGRCIFQGNTVNAFNYFVNMGFNCPANFNPADFFIKTLTQMDNRIGAKPDAINDFDVASEANQSNIESLNGNGFVLKQCRNHNSLWVKQVWILLQRTAINARRNLKKMSVALICYLVPFVSFGIFYSNLTGTVQEDVQNIQGIFFMLVCEIMFSVMYRCLNFCLASTPLLRRETNERIYGLSAYYVAEVLSDLPFFAIRPLCGLIITYNMAGFNKGIIFFLEMWLTLIFLAFTANAYGLMLVGIFRSVILEVPTVFNLIFLAVSGAYASLSDFPILKYSSLFYYAYEAISIFFWNDVSEIGCSERFEGLCLRNGTEVLMNISFNTQTNDVFWDFLGLVMLGSVMHTMAFIGIRRFIQSAGYY